MNQNSTSSEKTVKQHFGAVLKTQFTWVKAQKDSVKTLWLESWEVDVFGDRWTPIKTSLKKTAFFEARKVLSDHGLFDYRSEIICDKGKRVTRWLVKNLQGRKSSYWNDTKPRARIKSSYLIFLKSDYWQNVRQQVLDRDNHTCQQCKSVNNLQVHHLTYRNHRREHLHLEDLITLCKDCHSKVHGSSLVLR